MAVRSARKWRRILCAAVTAIVLAFAVQATLAQESIDGSFVLHEFFKGGDDAAVSAAPAEEASAQPEPARPGSGPGQPPTLSMEAARDEPIYGSDGPVTDEPLEAPYGPLNPFGSTNRLDSNTDRVNSLTYYGAFDPSVIPYKRVVVQNQVVRTSSGDYAVTTDPRRRAPVEIDTRVPAGTQTFWGSFLLRTERQKLHPIASVSPDQKILRVETEPPLPVTFYRDDADNFYVSIEHDGLVRVNVQVAVPAYYFGGEFSSEVRWSDFPQGYVPPLPADVVAPAGRVLADLGVSREQVPSEALIALVAHFRDFDARPFPAELRGGDLYESLAKHKIGVCRHRSLAFVITAQALGIPARYVYNEAHAFVEVFWPNAGWRRIDLGGAADELNAAAVADRAVHDPGRDQLPQPKRYLEEQQRMARNGWDGPGSGDGAGGDSAGGEQLDGAEPPAGDGAGQASEHAGAAEQGGTAADHPHAGETSDAPESMPHSAPLEAVASPEDARRATRLQILDATTEVRRGQGLALRVALSDAQGRPLDGRELRVYLGPVGASEPGQAMLIGRGVTDAQGLMQQEFPIPKNQAIGRWSVFIYFPGDSRHLAAVAE